jgi:hypothetical protein
MHRLANISKVRMVSGLQGFIVLDKSPMQTDVDFVS